MAGRLDGKVIVITGAAGGQGRASAQLFASEGARLALGDINDDGLDETVGLVRDEFPDAEILALKVDLRDVGQISGFMDAVITRFGLVDVLYNNAGSILRRPIAETTEEDWDHLMAVNLKATYFLIQQALPALRKSASPTILNASSTAGMHASTPFLSAYTAAKGAVISMTRALALDLRDDRIRVNCIAPGLVDTPMSRGFWNSVPEADRSRAEAAVAAKSLNGRAASPSEIAAVAAFLVSDAASYMNAAIVPVDGGATAI
jgi:NAD(P)-dependent dehydrogenase (short-subunit alcohol dehydrogenase family)